MRTLFYLMNFLVLTLFSVLYASGQDKLPAFPGAEGHGKYTTGGRGGKVIYVTNLEDNLSVGSLRYAINQTGARIVVFAVSGTIQLKSSLSIKNPNITIAGQTAPGDGICLRDYSVTNDADNVIIRFIRFRMGDETRQENDAFWGRNRKDIIIDHCSMSWSTDECSSFYDNTNFTLQWCLLSESLRNSVHGKGAHGYGGIWGGKNASFHHNLLAGHDSRNPRFCGSRYSNRPDLEVVDFRNNVIYNWGSNSIYAAEGGSYNLVNNYFKPGPATSSSSKTRIMQPYPDDGTNNQPAGIYGKFYVTGNYMSGNSAVTADNWLGVTPHPNFNLYVPVITKTEMRSDKEFPASNVTAHSAVGAYLKVLDYVGAGLKRDTVDKRIIHDVRTGTATFMSGGNGSVNGIIDTQSAVGGWPELKSLAAPVDTDGDGMPDAWEDAKGLLKNNPADAQFTTVEDKYPNLEVYLNSLVAFLTENELKDALTTSAKDFGMADDAVKMYLNNTLQLLQISHQQNITSVQIYSVTGSLIQTGSGNGTQAEMQVGRLSPGIYIVSVYDSKGDMYSTKILKN
jgi:pectate lyase